VADGTQPEPVPSPYWKFHSATESPESGSVLAEPSKVTAWPTCASAGRTESDAVGALFVVVVPALKVTKYRSLLRWMTTAMTLLPAATPGWYEVWLVRPTKTGAVAVPFPAHRIHKKLCQMPLMGLSRMM